jgi:ribosomal protein L40E
LVGASKYAEGIPVSLVVSWTGARKGDVLEVGIVDLPESNFVEGSRVAPLTCDPGPKKAACVLPEIGDSGSENFQFLLSVYSVMHTPWLAVDAGLMDRYGNWRSESFSTMGVLTIKTSDKALVTVSVPAGVPVTVDGVPQTSVVDKVYAYLAAGTRTISVQDVVSIDDSTRLRFDHWTDGITTTNRFVTLEDDMQFEVIYVRQFLLNLTSPYGNATGGGWYDQESSATFSVVAIQPMSGLFGLLGGKYVFSNWAGDSTSTAPNASVIMNGPKTVTAQWRADNTLPYVILGSIIAFMTIPLLLIVRRSSAQRPAPPTSTPPAPSAGTALQTIPNTLMPVKFCRRCGVKIPRDSEYCEECGTRLGSRSRE